MRSVLVVIPFIFASIATAQQPRLTCLSDVGVFATSGSSTVVKFIPKSTAITKATTLEAQTISVFASLKMTAATSGKTGVFVFEFFLDVSDPDPNKLKPFTSTGTQIFNGWVEDCGYGTVVFDTTADGTVNFLTGQTTFVNNDATIMDANAGTTLPIQGDLVSLPVNEADAPYTGTYTCKPRKKSHKTYNSQKSYKSHKSYNGHKGL